MSDSKKKAVSYLDTGGIYVDTGHPIEKGYVDRETGRPMMKLKVKSPSPGMVYLRHGKPLKTDLVPPRKRYPLDAVVAFIEKLVDDWKFRDGAHFTRSKMEKRLAERDAFPGISTTQVRAAWKKADLPERTWRKPGPK